MSILNTLTLESNSKVEINFSGGDLSSDSGLFLFNEFCHKIGLDKILKDCFHISSKHYRKHSEIDNLKQMLFQIFGAYYEDDKADHLTKEPVFTAILQKDSLASQPTISRFFNSMTEKTIDQLNNIYKALRKVIYSMEKPNFVIFDLDSTLLNTYGTQEGHAWNFHYQDNGYHPLVCYNGTNGELLKIQLRKGTAYSSNGVGDFMKPLFDEFVTEYQYTNFVVRGDSGFATPELYNLCEEYHIPYVIRLKARENMKAFVKEAEDRLIEKTKDNMTDYAVVYCEFEYQASTWDKVRRIVCKIEKPKDSFEFKYTYVVTTLSKSASPETVINFYCKRGQMENYIKECKNDFDFASTSSHTEIINANRLLVHGLAYNLANWMRLLVLPESMKADRMDTIRLKLIKIASRVIHHGRKIQYKFCSHYPYQAEFCEILENIRWLQPLIC